MSMISVSNLTFGYEGSYGNVFENISVNLDTDWRLGLTGRNGRGKTTLLRLLLGSQQHPYGLDGYQGSIRSKARFCYFPIPVEEMYPGSSMWMAMEVMQELCPGCPQWQIERELSLLDFDEEALWRPFSTLSGGERTKLQLAALFLQEGAFPLIDEPTNHLDAEGRQTVATYLSRRKGFLLVSHDRAFLDGCVDHIMAINRTDIEVRKGDFSGWYQDYLTRVQSETEQNRKLKKEIGRLEESAKRAAGWSEQVESSKIGQGPCDRGYIGHMAAKMMKRSKNIESRRNEAVEEKKKLLKNVENVGSLKIQPAEHFANKLVEGRELAVKYDGKELFEPITFLLQSGSKTALCGRNGSGKTSLLRLIEGENIDYNGKLGLAAGLKISTVKQDTSGLSGDMQEYLERCGVDRSLCMSILRNLGFEREQFDIPMENYSQGQKKKVLIAKSLCEQAHLYIWDEPLNYVDIFSRIQIEKMLSEQDATIIFVEHDKQFCENIASQTVEIRKK